MMIRTSVMTAALGAVAFSASLAPAATLLLNYDAASGQTPAEQGWTQYGTPMTNVGGVLKQNNLATPGQQSGEYLSPTLPAGTFTRNGADYGIEFRVQPLTDVQFVGGDWPQLYLTWSDSAFNYNVTIDKFGDDGSTALGDVVYGQGSFTPATRRPTPNGAPNIDWSVPHTIFIGYRGAAAEFDFYVDGVFQAMRVEGSMARSGSFARDAIDFGDGTTALEDVNADWHFVRVWNVSSPSAVPEPASLGALAAASAVLMRRRRR